jgi:hypothetical protein
MEKMNKIIILNNNLYNITCPKNNYFNKIINNLHRSNNPKVNKISLKNKISKLKMITNHLYI